jgi:hypothetical protein
MPPLSRLIYCGFAAIVLQHIEVPRSLVQYAKA